MKPTLRGPVRGAEIWRPDERGWLLEHGDGLYGDALDFDTVSRTLCFGRGEGLPGRAWDDARPVLLDDLSVRSFRRARFAAKAGYRAAVALPYFDDERLRAVVVLFFADASDVRLVEGTAQPHTDGDVVALGHSTLALTPSDALRSWDASPEDDGPLRRAVSAAFATGEPSIVRQDTGTGGFVTLPVTTKEAAPRVITIDV